MNGVGFDPNTLSQQGRTKIRMVHVFIDVLSYPGQPRPGFHAWQRSVNGGGRYYGSFSHIYSWLSRNQPPPPEERPPQILMLPSPLYIPSLMTLPHLLVLVHCGRCCNHCWKAASGPCDTWWSLLMDPSAPEQVQAKHQY